MIASRYGGGTGPPKMNVFERILSSSLRIGIEMRRFPRSAESQLVTFLQIHMPVGLLHGSLAIEDLNQLGGLPRTGPQISIGL